MNYCCQDLEMLMRAKGSGLGLIMVADKHRQYFILEYRNDWQVPKAEAGIEITFCPYCGSKLSDAFLKRSS